MKDEVKKLEVPSETDKPSFEYDPERNVITILKAGTYSFNNEMKPYQAGDEIQL